jgi:hypothetical protein
MGRVALLLLGILHCVTSSTSSPTSKHYTLASKEGAAKFLGPLGPDPLLGPVLATTGPGMGKPCVDCIFVGVTTCCKTWNRTEILLKQLVQSNDNMHIVVFDDMSLDDTKDNAERLGFAVMQPPKLKVSAPLLTTISQSLHT